MINRDYVGKVYRPINLINNRKHEEVSWLLRKSLRPITLGQDYSKTLDQESCPF